MGGLLRHMPYTDPQEQRRCDDGYDEGLLMREAEREAARENKKQPPTTKPE